MFVKGQSGNPKGRPPGRSIANLLLSEWDIQEKHQVIWRILRGLNTGYLDFETKTKTGNKKIRRLKLSSKEYIDLFRFVTTHLDGPAKIDISIAHEGANDDGPFTLPADVIAPSFIDAYRDIARHGHTEYVLSGGRGSTKSSFVSLVIIYLIKNNPAIHALATRQVANTLRDSVYAQLQWAIGELGLTDQFKCTTSPLEIEYLPTGQKIYFRGADDPGKIKSIKPTFGYIGILWFEELDQFPWARGNPQN